MKKRFLTALVAGFWVCGQLFAQVANDDCSTAQNLGVMPNSSGCNGQNTGQGTPQVFPTTNVSAVPANPYVYMTGCQTGGNMAAPSDDVWYQVTLAAPELIITVDNSTFSGISIGIWEGTCGNLFGVGCAESGTNSLTATFGALSVGTTYYIQVSGSAAGDQSTFDLTLQNNDVCDLCLADFDFSVTPQPINGNYQSSDTVTFCLDITDWDRQANNWLNGVEVTFGAGWDMSSLQTSPPVTCDGQGGTWGWYNSVTSTATGASYGPGFFFDRNNNGNPGDDFGDNCGDAIGGPPSAGPADWLFCWDISPVDCPPGTTGTDLSIVVNTLADGEAGSWTSPACLVDPDIFFGANLTCCPIPIVTQQNPFCNGDSSGWIAADGQGVGPWDYQWVEEGGGTTVQTTNNATGPDTLFNQPAGTYTVHVTDQNDGCITSVTVTLVNPAVLVAAIDSFWNVSCFGAMDGAAWASATGGTPGTTGYSYDWSDGQTGPNATGLGPGTYWVTVTDSVGCMDSVSVTITEPPVLTATAVVDSHETCLGAADGGATAAGGGGTPGYGYNWSTGANTPSITGLGAGTYTVTVTDINGCTATDQVTINPGAQVLAGMSSTQSLCGADGTATSTPSGGTSPYDFSWSTGASDVGAATSTIVNLLPGWYYVTVTDQAGCQVVDSVEVLPSPTQPVAQIDSVHNVSCFGLNDGEAFGSVLSGTPPYDFMWSSGQTDMNVLTSTATGLGPGNYYLAIADDNGCPDTVYFSITEPLLLSVSVNVDSNVSCNGGTDGGLTATAGGGTPSYGYSWSNGGTTATITGLAAGTYTVTVTDSNGCTAIDSAVITEPPAIIASAVVDSNVTCNAGSDGGATASGTGGTGGYNYNWSNGAVTPSITGVPAGNYFVTVTDANGCWDSTSVTITEPTPVVASAVVDSNETCGNLSNGGATASGSGGAGGYSYNWSNGATTASITGIAAGTYTVTVTDASGCVDSTTVTINQLPGVTAAFALNPASGCAVPHTVFFTDQSTLPDTWFWDFGDGNTSTLQNPVHNYTSGGVFTVTLTVTDTITGCSDTATSTVTVTTPVADFNGAPLFGCNPLTVNFTDISTGFGGGMTFAWDFGDGNTSTQQNPTHTYTTPGVYTVTLQVTDSLGCTDTEIKVNYVQVIGPDVNFGADTTYGCAPFTVNFTDSTIFGAPITSWTWDFGDGNTSNLQNPTHTYTAPGIYTVSLTVTDIDGCTATLTDTNMIAVAQVIAGFTMSDSLVCIGDLVTFTDTSTGLGLTWAWDFGDGNTSTLQNPTHSYAAGGNFLVELVVVDTITGCTAADTQYVNVSPVMSLTMTADSMVSCNGGSDGGASVAVAGGTPSFTYAWSTGGNTAAVAGLAAGTYYVTVTDSAGCAVVDSVNITEPSPLVLNGGSDSANCAQANGTAWVVPFGGTSGYGYLWNTGAATDTVTGLVAGSYTVTVTDANGCMDSLSVTVYDVPGTTAMIDSSMNVSCIGAADGAAWGSSTGGSGTISYSWSDGQVGQAATGLSAGTYWFYAQDTAGCIDSAMVVITEPASGISASDSLVNVSCPGSSDGEIWIINTTGGTAPYTYSLDGGPFQAGNNFGGLPSDTFSVTVMDSNGCTLTLDTLILTEPTPITATDTTIDVLCEGDDNGQIIIQNVNGGAGGYTYSIDSTNWSANDTISGLSAGTYTIYIQDANGCITTLVDSIGEPDPLDVALIPTPATCIAGGLVISNVSGGTGPYSYLWSNGDTTANLLGVPAGFYTVMVTDANGCTSGGFTLVFPPDEPDLNLVNVTGVSCYGDEDGSVTVSTSGGTGFVFYQWSVPALPVDTSLTGLAPGTYGVTVTDILGCSDSLTFTIPEPDSISLAATLQDPYCPGTADGYVTVTPSGGTPGYNYLWDDSTGQTSATATGLGAGTYMVIVSDSNGCATTAIYTLTDPPPVVAAFSSNPPIPADLNLYSATVMFTNESVNATSYNWSFGDGNGSTDTDPVHTYSTTGQFCVELIAYDSVGCADTTEACAYNVSEDALVIPNTFTPNGDGINDYFEIVGIYQFPNNKLVVFNRWGNKVYEKDQYNNDWDGTDYNSGQPLPDGAYFYIFSTGLEGKDDIMGDVVIYR